MTKESPFTAFQLVRYTIFLWLALKRVAQDNFNAKFRQWIDEHHIVGVIHPRTPIKEIREFTALVAGKILKDDSEKLVSELTPEQLMDYVSTFLSQDDHNLPECQIVFLLKPRYIFLSELICRYQKTSLNFGDECSNESDVLHFIKDIKHLCSKDVWNELINQVICVSLYETFGSPAITTEASRATGTTLALMHGDAMRHLKRFGLMYEH